MQLQLLLSYLDWKNLQQLWIQVSGIEAVKWVVYNFFIILFALLHKTFFSITFYIGYTYSQRAESSPIFAKILLSSTKVCTSVRKEMEII